MGTDFLKIQSRNLHVILFAIYDFRENLPRKGALFLWVSMKLHLRVYRKTASYFKISNALVYSVYHVTDYSIYKLLS